jgi:hypothetical protein
MLPGMVTSLVGVARLCFGAFHTEDWFFATSSVTMYTLVLSTCTLLPASFAIGLVAWVQVPPVSGVDQTLSSAVHEGTEAAT